MEVKAKAGKLIYPWWAVFGLVQQKQIFIAMKAISDIFFNKIVIWITYFFIFFFDDWNNRGHVPVDMRRPLNAYWILEVFWTEVSPL